MLTFLLGVLKVIGIILLILLLLILVILGVVLFVPIRYRGNGRFWEEQKEAQANVTWLLKLVRFRLDYHYPEKPVMSLKILWIDVLKLLEKKKQKAKQKEESASADIQEEADSASNVSVQVKPQNDISWETYDVNQQHEAASIEEEADTGLPWEEADWEEEKVPLKEKIQNIIFKISSIYDKMKDVVENLQYYLAILQEEDTKQLLSEAWGAIVKILKSIRPEVFEVKGEFGFETPDTTGQAYGAYCALRPMVGNSILLEPNFEEQVIRVNAKLNGRITMFVIVVNVLRILLDKRLQPLIHKLKNGGSQYVRE